LEGGHGDSKAFDSAALLLEIVGLGLSPRIGRNKALRIPEADLLLKVLV
jgi:hypothetical protein